MEMMQFFDSYRLVWSIIKRDFYTHRWTISDAINLSHGLGKCNLLYCSALPIFFFLNGSLPVVGFNFIFALYFVLNVIL